MTNEFFPQRIDVSSASEDVIDEHAARYGWARSWLKEADPILVADVAAGTGYGAEVLRGTEPDRVGVISFDISFDALARGHERHNLLSVTADATSLPCRDESFDAVVSIETIEHLPNFRGLMREFRRVLKPKGLLVLSSPNFRISRNRNPHHAQEFTLRELRALARETDFQIEGVAGQGWVFPISEWSLRVAARTPGMRGVFWRLSGRKANLGMRIDPRIEATSSRGVFRQPRYWLLALRR